MGYSTRALHSLSTDRLMGIAASVIFTGLFVAQLATPAAATRSWPGDRPTLPLPDKQSSVGVQGAVRPPIMAQAAAVVGEVSPAKLAPRQAVTPLRSRASAAPGLQPAAIGPLREVFGFAAAGSLGDPNVGYTTWNFSTLSTVAYFGLTVKADGSLNQADTGWSTWHSSIASGLIKAAHANGVKVVVSLIAHQQAELCSALSPNSQQVTVAQTGAQLMGADGVNLDYEGGNQTCGDGVSLRTRLVQLAQAFHTAGTGYLSIDTYASSAEDPGGFFDIANLAPSVDSLFVMAYGLETSNGPCSTCIGATSPLGNNSQNAYPWNDERVASDYAPWSAKVILGLPYYGIKACTTSTAPNAPGVQGTWGADPYTTITSYPSDPNISGWAASRDALDPEGQEPWASFYSGYAHCAREEYWDDALSLGHKYDLVLRAGLRGAGIFTLDYGGGAAELWDQLQLHFSTLPTRPATVTACATQNAALVSWSPASSSAGPVTGYVVTASPGGQSASVAGGITEGAVGGLTTGTNYTFTVAATNALGSSAPSAASNPVAPQNSAPVGTSYFNWFDRASPGMFNDNLHLVNPAAAGSAPSTGCALVAGVAVAAFSVNPQSQTIVSLPQGTIGGPVRMITNSGPQPLVSQRVQYFQSFNETPAVSPGQAATDLWLPWYDLASPGMLNDNIHLVNPGSSVANVTITGPGPAIGVQVPAGQEVYRGWPHGTIGGPVHIVSDQPLLASQRVQYFQSFNESPARSAGDAKTLVWFNWYDLASPGMFNDNIHLLNPGSSSASVQISLGGGRSAVVPVPPGGEAIAGFPRGTIGGPVRLSSDKPVLATQRVQYFDSFNETGGLFASQTSLWFPWYDLASPGMFNDNIHIVNPGSGAANLTITGPGQTVTLTVGPGEEAIRGWPQGSIGGPVHVSADQPVIASQRVQYFQSFNESVGLAG